MKAVTLALSLFAMLLVSPAVAQSSCGDLMENYRVGATPEEIAAATGPGIDGCTSSQQALFRLNGPALDVALPASQADVIGTWLGDDVLLYVQGLVVAGQEVLRISAGEGGGIVVEQFWFKAIPPGQRMPYWDMETGYAGLVSRIEYGGTSFEGQWELSFGDPASYTGLTFEHERSHDLFVMQQLHRTETGGLLLALAGDTLVMRGEVLSQPLRLPLRPTLATFTRAADGSHDLALQLVVIFQQSQARFFECLTHQISEGAGPFADAVAPYGMAEVQVLADRLFEAEVSRDAVMQTFSSDMTETETVAAREAMIAAVDAIEAAQAEPLYAAIEAAMTAPDACVQF